MEYSEAEWREHIRTERAEYVKEMYQEELEFCLKARGRYLLQQITALCDEVVERRKAYQDNLKAWGPLIERQMIAYPLAGLEQKCASLIKQAEGVLQRLDGAVPDISDGDIERAREYPIANLIEARNNMARCIWHDDNNPSMTIKGNFAYCFSCGKSGDAISVYMQVRGLDFKTAIKEMI